jgi:hypothetical protein
MKILYTLFLMIAVAATANAGGAPLSYTVNGQPYEGYFVSPSPNAPWCS